MRHCSHPFQAHNRMPICYSPFIHCSIQLFSCIKHNLSMLQMCSCHTYYQSWCVDHNILNNYRPVSNQWFFANILEKLVLSYDSSYLKSNNHCKTFQSAYRPGRITETAILKIVNDMFLSLGNGNMTVLALLQFSSAFDVNYHSIFLNCHHTDFGLSDAVL